MSQHREIEAVTVPEGYRLSPEGLYSVAADGTSNTRLAGPVWVSAFTEDKSDGRYGFVVNWVDRRGRQRERAFPSELLHEQGRTLPMALASNGLEILPGKERALVCYLGHFDSNNTNWIQSVPQLGWIPSNTGELAYMTASHGVISGTDFPRVIFQPEQNSPTVLTMTANGTLEDWNRKVAIPCEQNPLLLFAACFGFAGPLLKHAQLESGGFHFFGRSSQGKTTAAQVAASVFGCGSDPADAPERSYVQRWNSTKNAYEALLAAHNDSYLVLDEIHTADDRDFGSVIYNLAGGKGKQSLMRNRELRAPRSWRTLVFSTGEISVKQKIEQERRTSHAGQLLRMIDVSTDAGIIVDAGMTSPAEFARQLKLSCSTHYGVAGPAFLRELVASYESSYALTETIKMHLEQELSRIVPASIAPEQRRALNRFALISVAGQLASKLGVLDVPSSVIQKMIDNVTATWLSNSANLPDYVRGVLAIRDFVMRHQARFRDVHPSAEASQIRDIAGYRDRNQRLFLFTADGFQEACGEASSTAVAKALADAGLLKTGESRRLQSKHTVDGHRPRFYAVRESIIEYEASDTQGREPGPIGTIGAGENRSDSTRLQPVPAVHRLV